MSASQEPVWGSTTNSAPVVESCTEPNCWVCGLKEVGARALCAHLLRVDYDQQTPADQAFYRHTAGVVYGEMSDAIIHLVPKDET